MALDLLDATAEALPLELLNVTNKELTAQLSRCEQLCDDHTREVEDQRRRLQFVKEHLGNVRGEIVNTQSLVESKRREVESETHMYRILDRECGRLRQDQMSIQTQQAGLQEQLQAVQNRTFQENLRMAEIKETMAINQEALEQWDVARRQKEADEEAVARYTKSDAVRLRQLDVAVERKEAELRDRRRQLQDEMGVMRSVQIELDHAATDYRGLHDERSSLLDEWERVVQTIHARDGAIGAAAAQYADGATWLEERRAVLKAKQLDLETARGELTEVQATIANLEKRAEKDRLAKAALDVHVVALEDEVLTLREHLSEAVRQRNNSRIRATQSRIAVKEKTAALKRGEEKRAHVKAQLQGASETATDLVTQRVTIAQLLQEARAADRRLGKEVEELRRESFVSGERLHAARSLQEELVAEISGGQAHARNLRMKIGQLDREHFAQQDVLYSVEFNVQQMQRKVSRAKGERTDDERNKLEEKIKALQSTLDEVNVQQRALDTQVKRVREEMRQGTMEVAKLTAREEEARDKMVHLRLSSDTCEVELSKLCKQREEKLVRVDTQELQLQGLKRMLHQRSGELRDISEQKKQLAMDVVERVAEIAVHQDLLKMEAKLAEEERRRLVAELQERQKCLGGLRNRYDVKVGQMDPEQAHWSQAQLVMEAAREREALQQRGDTLDGRVARVERELLKLERTLHIIRASNSNYRHMFDRVREDDDAVKTRQAMQAQQRELKATISRLTIEENGYQQALHTKETELQQMLERRDCASATATELQHLCARTHETILQDREALIRYDQAVTRARAAVAPEVDAGVTLQEQQQRFQAVVGRVLQATQRHSDAAGDTARTLLGELCSIA